MSFSMFVAGCACQFGPVWMLTGGVDEVLPLYLVSLDQVVYSLVMIQLDDNVSAKSIRKNSAVMMRTSYG